MDEKGGAILHNFPMATHEYKGWKYIHRIDFDAEGNVVRYNINFYRRDGRYNCAALDFAPPEKFRLNPPRAQPKR